MGGQSLNQPRDQLPPYTSIHLSMWRLENISHLNFLKTWQVATLHDNQYDDVATSFEFCLCVQWRSKLDKYGGPYSYIRVYLP